MAIDSPEHRRERSKSSELRAQDDSSSKHRGKSSRREDKDYRREKDLERDRSSGKDRRSDDKDKQERERSHGKSRESKERERDKDRKDRGKDKEREKEILDRDSERGREKDRGKERSREKDRDREKEREKEKDKHKEQGKVRESERGRHKDVVDKEKIREREKEADQDGERQRDKDKGSHKHRNEGHDRSKHSRNDDESGSGATDNQGTTKMDTGLPDSEDSGKHQQDVDRVAASSEMGERIRRMKEERLKKKPEGVSDIMSWVAKSRKMEERKARQLSKTFEERDNMIEGDDDGTEPNASHDLAGVKVLHGLDKVLEGGAVVLTLRDQNILSDRGVNEEVDELENVEIGEQKKRDDAYKAAQKKRGIFTDKFNEDDSLERKMLPQYDDPITDEGLTLDARGSFTADSERKLEELRKRIQGNPKSNYAEDLTTTGKVLSDYYTEEEMLKFNKKPKKKKTMRKREKLDIDAMEEEAKSSGLGNGDLGSRSDGRRQALRQERERDDAEKRKSAYQSALAKAEEASKALLAPKRKTVQDEDDSFVIGDDDDDLRKSLDRARKLALKSKSEAATSYPMTINLIPVASESAVDNKTTPTETSENKVVFTEMELWSRQLDEEVQKSDGEDVFMDEDVVPNDSEEKEVKVKVEEGGWSEAKADIEEKDDEKKEEETALENTIHETSVGKGLAGTLQLLNKRGSLKESIEWGGRNMDKKKSKLVGIHEDDGPKEIHLERTDEYGRILTPREAFRLLSHKFHGKGPGKMKQEKRMRQYQEELKIKQMENSDTPSHSVERMKEVQAQLKTPYLVLTGQVKPGQTSDPRSGFATVDGLPGGLTPMLGNQKVDFFLGKRKHESGGSGSSVDKKPKT